MLQSSPTAGNTAERTLPTWSIMAEVSQILCPRCHKQNLRRARFCQHCGHDMVLNNNVPNDERRYVITRVIKQGGQGAIYEGLDETGKRYAIKEMRDTFTDPRERAEAIASFNAEAEVLQRLNHPRIPQVYSHFRDEGRHYLTMEFVAGEDLDEIITRVGRIEEPQVLIWAAQICDVLDHLHSRGLVYRDMKPSNVMIERESGGVKLIDFGITHLFEPSKRSAQIGTPGYAPPEQYQGIATPQSDIYALGATLHHLLSGRDPVEQLPFSFPPVRSLAPLVSRRTNVALERALQKVPRDRFNTVREFWTALDPAPLLQPAQVRVAPASGRMAPAAAQLSGAPPRLKVNAAQTVRSEMTTPTPAAPVLPARIHPLHGLLTTAGALFSALVRLLVTVAVLAVLGLGLYVYLERPAWAEPFVAPLFEEAPGAWVEQGWGEGTA